MRVTFNELAERELNDAAHYYELEQPGLDSAFITDIQRCTEAIVAHPLARVNRLGHNRTPLGRTVETEQSILACENILEHQRTGRPNDGHNDVNGAPSS